MNQLKVAQMLLVFFPKWPSLFTLSVAHFVPKSIAAVKYNCIESLIAAGIVLEHGPLAV